MTEGTWSRYAAARGEYLALIRQIRATGPSGKDWRYLPTLRQELAACRRQHWAKGRQRRYNLQRGG